eukprot:7244465-Prymnesium_polylepis.2
MSHVVSERGDRGRRSGYCTLRTVRRYEPTAQRTPSYPDAPSTRARDPQSLQAKSHPWSKEGCTHHTTLANRRRLFPAIVLKALSMCALPRVAGGCEPRALGRALERRPHHYLAELACARKVRGGELLG